MCSCRDGVSGWFETHRNLETAQSSKARLVLMLNSNSRSEIQQKLIPFRSQFPTQIFGFVNHHSRSHRCISLAFFVRHSEDNLTYPMSWSHPHIPAYSKQHPTSVEKSNDDSEVEVPGLNGTHLSYNERGVFPNRLTF